MLSFWLVCTKRAIVVTSVVHVQTAVPILIMLLCKFFLKVQQPLVRQTSYLDHSGRSGLSFYDAWPQGLCLGMVLVVKIYDSFKKSFYAILLILKQLKQIVGQTSVNIMPLTLGHEVKVRMTFISHSSDFASYLEDWCMFEHLIL